MSKTRLGRRHVRYQREDKMLIRHLAAVGGDRRPAFDLLVLGSSCSETAIAGGAGTSSRLIGAGGDYQGVYRIVWAENSNIAWS